MTRNEGMIRGEWGYFGHGAKLDNVFFFLLALKINFVIDELWTSSSDFKEYVFQSSQHLEKYVVQLSSVSQIAALPYDRLRDAFDALGKFCPYQKVDINIKLLYKTKCVRRLRTLYRLNFWPCF